jgi:hypothetical protein
MRKAGTKLGTDKFCEKCCTQLTNNPGTKTIPMQTRPGWSVVWCPGCNHNQMVESIEEN